MYTYLMFLIVISCSVFKYACKININKKMYQIYFKLILVFIFTT